MWSFSHSQNAHIQIFKPIILWNSGSFHYQFLFLIFPLLSSRCSKAQKRASFSRHLYSYTPRMAPYCHYWTINTPQNSCQKKSQKSMESRKISVLFISTYYFYVWNTKFCVIRIKLIYKKYLMDVGEKVVAVKALNHNLLGHTCHLFSLR